MASTQGQDPWYPKTLLSFDGGGVRGFSSLLILEALMKEIQKLEMANGQGATSSAHPLEPRSFDSSKHCFGPESGHRGSLSKYLVSHYFDYIAGTSTGGLIAIMLGRFSMTIDECIKAYEELIPNIFAKRRWLHFGNARVPRYKYDATNMETILQRFVEERSGKTNVIMKQPNEDMCRVITLAWQQYADDDDLKRVPTLFRSYNHPISRHPNERNPGPSCTESIWRVARATSAAPPYFRPIELEGTQLIDGGFGANNPTSEAWNSIRQLHNNNHDAVQVLISIGTGHGARHRRTRMKNFYPTMWSHYQTMKAMVTDTETVDGQMLSNMNNVGSYYRLNVKKGLGNHDVPLDACKGKEGRETLKIIREMTEVYLQSDMARSSIETSAKKLVGIRTARSNGSDPDRWERFCHGLKYKCPMANCQDTGQRFELRLNLEDHLRQRHLSSTNDLRSQIIRGKCYSVEERE